MSVFAIGFNQHFSSVAGADASITNSNSNFGQFALSARGFKKDAFAKDDQGFITQIVTPNNAFNQENDDIEAIDYVNIDFEKTRTINFANQLYLLGYTNLEDRPPAVTQGFRVGAKYDDLLTQTTFDNTNPTAQIRMVDEPVGPGNNNPSGNNIARKVYEVVSGPINNTINIGVHGLVNGESIRVFSATGDLPENLEVETLYYANIVDGENIRISTSESNALNNLFVSIYGGTELRVESQSKR